MEQYLPIVKLVFWPKSLTIGAPYVQSPIVYLEYAAFLLVQGTDLPLKSVAHMRRNIVFTKF